MTHICIYIYYITHLISNISYLRAMLGIRSCSFILGKRNTQEKRAPEAQATASTVLLHRRSYKASSVFCGDLVKWKMPQFYVDYVTK